MIHCADCDWPVKEVPSTNNQTLWVHTAKNTAGPGSYGKTFLHPAIPDQLDLASEAVRNSPCSCGEPGVGSLVQCDRHHGVGCYCFACVA